MKIHLPLGLRLSSGDIFRSSIIFVVIIASLVFASVRAVAVDNGGCSYIGCQPRGGEIGGGFSLWGCVDGFVFGHDS
ncbi:hypothetical protein AY514_08020 [Corynebacterium diphtheriae bv. gravis]|nr:hypothetical protein AY514_08020 [Corynebacterium diphtheriae bv. gravis]OWN74799.1 hypothetical protein AY516_10055 [Corynebacterium diphtheriae bv. mitis]